jgi:hypothetical protein
MVRAIRPCGTKMALANRSLGQLLHCALLVAVATVGQAALAQELSLPAGQQIPPGTPSPYGMPAPAATPLPQQPPPGYPAMPAYSSFPTPPPSSPPVAYLPPSCPPAAASPLQVPTFLPGQSAVYTRIDYFTWREDVGGSKILDESGPLVGLGFVTSSPFRRFRAEVFGGVVQYNGGVMWDDGTEEPLQSTTGLLGCRAELDFLHHFVNYPSTAIFLGLGTRFWDRNLRDSTTDSGGTVIGYDELWWTLYPRIGLETEQPFLFGSKFFASASGGCTVFTLQDIHRFGVTLFPKIGPQFQAEMGIRGDRTFFSVVVEGMKWFESDTKGDQQFFQPESFMFTVGARAGYVF